MKRIERLQALMTHEEIIISDAKMIEYFIGHLYHTDERLLALSVPKTGEPTLFINQMFPKPENIKTITFSDAERSIDVLKANLKASHIGVDGKLQARFVLPLQESLKLDDISSILERVRAIKTPEERAIMVEASHRNDAIMDKVKNALTVGMTEIELSNQIIAWQSEAPQTGVSFDPIALFSENMADPHGVPSNRILKEDDAVLIDMGGFYNGYASDMTRCFFMGNNKKAEELYEIVLQANLAAINIIKPGIKFSDIDKAARDVITEAGYGEYFVHRTGHGIGMETHETLDVSSANDTIVEEGMCFSIEPGIYIEGVAGIRIEDLVHVTKDACFVMNDYPKSLTEVFVN